MATGSDWLVFGSSCLAAYLLGSLSFGVLVARLSGKGDLRVQGSGNPGTLNAARVLGKGWGLLVLGLDVGRGAGASLLATQLVPGAWQPQAALACLLAGNLWPVFHTLRGGKGVATALGLILGLDWIVGLAGPAVWLLAALATGWGSLGSLAMALAFPALLLARGQAWPVLALGGLAALAVIFKHRANLGRMSRGEEPRLFRRGSV
jgi:glycerol-3-phosphate acyltransferase PlsY